jgi:hypothetical protein
MRLSPATDDRPLTWTIRVTVLSSFVMLGILALFYATDEKPLAMRLMRAVNPLSLLLPRLTEGMPLSMFSARVYDFLVVAAMAFQGCAVGAIIDFIRRLRRRIPNNSSPSAR